MDYKKIMSLFLMVLCVNSCHKKVEKKRVTKNKNTDIFYTETEGLDYIRFPLSKPFDITSADARTTWFLGKGHNTKVYADNISEICVVNDISLIHCKGETIVGNDVVNEAWYVYSSKIDTIPKEFNSKKGFDKFVKKLNIKYNEILWVSPFELFKQFEETGCLQWIPSCE